jgi:hypothetical protein
MEFTATGGTPLPEETAYVNERRLFILLELIRLTPRQVRLFPTGDCGSSFKTAIHHYQEAFRLIQLE